MQVVHERNRHKVNTHIIIFQNLSAAKICKPAGKILQKPCLLISSGYLILSNLDKN